MKLYQKPSEKSIMPFFIKRRFCYSKVIKLLKPKKKDKILDIGCGTGKLVELLRNYSNFVLGIDINKELIETSGIRDLQVMPAEKLEFENNFFDKIVSIHTIEHIPDLKQIFKEMERVLKKEGICLLVYPCEIFRGSNIFLWSLCKYKNPFVFRRLHVHKLNPQKIESITSLKAIKKGLFLSLYPNYYTLLKKL